MTTSQLLATVSTADLAAILGLTPRRVRQLATEGIIPAPKKAGHDLSIAVQAAIAHARLSRDAAPLAAARARVAEARARQIEQQIAEADGRLIDLTEALEILDEIAGLFISGLEGFPARIGMRDLVIRKKVREEVDALRAQIHRKVVEKCTEMGGNP